MDPLPSSVEVPSLRSHRLDSLIGNLLLDAGKLHEADIPRIIALQREQGLRFGDAALQLGIVLMEDLQRALSQQFQNPYLPEGDESLHSALIAARDPFDEQTELLRALRSELILRWFDTGHKTLAITSATAGTGCSEVAANLALVFAQLGVNTLLIDADLCNPKQHELFGLTQGPGLSNVLAGRGSLKENTTIITPFRQLAVMCAGPTPPNPQELLSRPSFTALIDSAGKAFDIVIVDAGPMLVNAGAQVIAARAGGCLLMLRRNQTRMDDLARLQARLKPTSAVVVGAVIND